MKYEKTVVKAAEMGPNLGIKITFNNKFNIDIIVIEKRMNPCLRRYVKYII